MYRQLESRLNKLINSKQTNLFDNRLIGLEKESLRVSEQGKIVQTSHPIALGAALTHPYITTDYSEALLELITPPSDSPHKVLSFLKNIHRFVYDNLDNELLWASSMPCIVSGDASIPVAYYGSSNAGKMKSLYRTGLGHRYGRMMQVIAGIHYNFSLAEHFWPAYQELETDSQSQQAFISAQYLGLTRNLQRYGWLIPYLFGASPAVCRSFIDGPAVGLDSFDEFTYYQPYATSLRLGDIGYQNYKEGESGIKANYDSLTDYIDSLTCAINTPYEPYKKIGVKVNDTYKQLNANILQIENEYYSSVRPKQLTEAYEKPSLALKRRGVRYVELRSLDLNVFEPAGINQQHINFLETFLIFCLLQESPPISALERREIDINQSTSAHRGREPKLKLQRNGKEIQLSIWLHELLDNMQAVAEILDDLTGKNDYTAALNAQKEVAKDPDRTPSAAILNEMRSNKESFFPFAMRYSKNHSRYFQNIALSDELHKFFSEYARNSIQQQTEIEANDNESFDTFLANYFAQT